MIQSQAAARKDSSQLLSQKFVQYLLFAILALSFGGTFIAAKVVVAEVTPLQATALRVGLALLILQLVSWSIKGGVRVPRSLLLPTWFSGLCLYAIPLTLLFSGMRSISAGLGGVIEATIPLFTFVMSALVIRSQQKAASRGSNGPAVVSLLIGFLGVLLIFKDKIQMGSSSAELLGAAGIVFGMAIYALGTVVTRRVLDRGVDANACVLHQNLASFVFIIVIALVRDGLPSVTAATLSTPFVVAVLFLAILPNVIGAYIYTYLIREWGSVRAAAVCYVVPITAIVLDYLFYATLPSQVELLGCMTILLGVYLLQSAQSGGAVFRAAGRVVAGLQQGLRRTSAMARYVTHLFF